MSHLPFEAHEEDYREEAVQRYERLENNVNTVFDGADSTDIGTAGFASSVGAWIAARQRQHGLVPGSTLPVNGGENQWFDDHAVRSYRAGQEFARTAMDERGINPPRTPGVDRSPRHQHALKEVHERQRRYWGSLATDLRDDVQQVITQDISDGTTLTQARSAVRDRIEKKGLHRARYITETEPAWGFNRAMLEEYADAGMENVHVDVSWETAGDQNVCPDCAARSGTYSVGEARQMMEINSFPEHPLCRCLLMPGR